MKQEAGWGAAALVFAAAIGLSSLGSKPAQDVANAGKAGSAAAAAKATRTSASAFEQGPCVDLEDRLQHFFLVKEAQIAAPESCYLGTKGAQSPELQGDAAGIRVMIATLPDPLHTHLPLVFDRMTEAIQQAAADEHYLYDSSWLPWDAHEDSYALLKDKDEAEDRKKRQEDQPGILLFRNGADTKSPFKNGLVVFVVGEEATGGIHRQQFANAVQWAQALQPPTEKGFVAGQVRILGPSFSGSFPSLVALLSEEKTHRILEDRLIADPGATLEILSGNVASEHGVDWFEQAVGSGQAASLHIHFHSTQQSDRAEIESYCRLLSSSDDLSRLAIVSEDETAFGAEYSYDTLVTAKEPSANAKPDFCAAAASPRRRGGIFGFTEKTAPWERPAYFYYPRDISALRAAYQSQSIFSTAADSSAQTARRTLQTDLADPEGDDHDTVKSYSGMQTALSQEAELQHLASMLRAHDAHYILLRSSNPLDQLFLSHFFKLAYPEARVVIVGSDLLLRRETGASGLNGTMMLSTYPLLHWENDWTKPDMHAFHGHRVFSQDTAEGTYAAGRMLLRSDFLEEIDRAESYGKEYSAFMPMNLERGFDLRDYAAPFWRTGTAPQVARWPAAWLSVLGNDGFWPVAALDEKPRELLPRSVQQTFWHKLEQQLALLLAQEPAGDEPFRWQPMPLSMKLLLVLVGIWVALHATNCFWPSLTVKPGHRAHFVRIKPESRQILVSIGGILLAMVTITIWWGCGGMSPAGMPLQNPLFCRIVLLVMWIVTGLATVTNRGVESWLCSGQREVAGSTRARRLEVVHDSWLSAAAYLLGSAAYFAVLGTFLERVLTDENRISTYWRCMNLMNGVSPLVPLLALLAGLYGWAWYGLQGGALLGRERSRLPFAEQLQIRDADGKMRDPLRMLSDERGADPIENLSRPFSWQFQTVFSMSATVLLGLEFLILGSSGIRSLGASSYNVVFLWMLVAAVSILLASAYQLFHVWLRLRHMLMFLDRLPLRRTLDALKGFSWGSIWTMSGNILDMRYKLVYRQFETLTHLRASLDDYSKEQPAFATELKARLDVAGRTRMEFADWYGKQWDQWSARNLTPLVELQGMFAAIAGRLITEMLVPEWRTEDHSLVLDLRSEGDDEKGKTPHLAEQIDLHVRNAEEFVCLVYMGFIQNILGKMRSLVTSMICLFISITIAVSSYPFDPRPFLSGSVILIFVLLGVVVVTVYSQMHRDTTLSHLTNTKPGELGTEFWIKLIGFGAGPVIGVVASVFPEFANFFFSWLQPGMAAVK